MYIIRRGQIFVFGDSGEDKEYMTMNSELLRDICAVFYAT